MDPLEKEVLGSSPQEAARILGQAGFQVETERTAPPRDPASGWGRERVLRVLFRGKTGIITIAREMGIKK